jgi:hypothetical protein
MAFDDLKMKRSSYGMEILQKTNQVRYVIIEGKQ